MYSHIVVYERDIFGQPHVCFDKLRIVSYYRAVVVVVTLMLVYIIGHAGIENFINSPVY